MEGDAKIDDKREREGTQHELYTDITTNGQENDIASVNN